MSTLSSVSPISPSDPLLLLSRYVIKPVDRIGHMLFWGSMTISVTLGTFQFGLILLEEVLPTYSFLWGIGVPVLRTPIGGLLGSIVVLLLLNMYCVKKTRRAYHELRVWMVEVHISLPVPHGERHLFHHLTVVWSKTRKSVPELLAVFPSVFQGLQTHQEQQGTSSGALSVLTEPETTVTVLSLDQSSLSDAGVSAEAPPSVVSGIFGTVLSFCHIRVVGPTGKEHVLDLQHRAFLPLWLYLIAHTLTGRWISVGDILADVYGYDEWSTGGGKNEVKAEKRRLSNQFHDHRRVLRKEINRALRDVGLPQTDLLRNERRNGTSYWRLSDTLQMQDLTLIEDCRTVLAAVEERSENDAALHEQALATCKQTCLVIADMAPIQDASEMPGIEKLLRETLMTSSQALTYLAQESHTAAQKTTDTQAKHRLLRKEERYWATSALTCARFASHLPGYSQQLSHDGEDALRNALSCCLDLRDHNLGFALYQEYREASEQDDDPWEPETKTERLWQKVLAMDGDEVV